LTLFITKFVLCGKCSNPETNLLITKDQNVIRTCLACGQTSNVDMGHRLTQFILKNPPEGALQSGTDGK
jgi:translation initiation factor 5